MSFRDRLQACPKSGYTPTNSTLSLRELEALLSTSPRQHGYHHAEWTASLLEKVLQREHALDVRAKTMRRCLQQSHYVWKRPGYALARQSVTWAQEKGGSREVSTPLQEV